MKQLFFVVMVTLSFGFLSAGTPRAVVLTQVNVDGRNSDSKPLLSTVEHEMKQKGFRIVDIATSLMAQYTTLEKKIKQGKIPKALSKYNADVIAAFTLSCTKTSSGVMGSNLKTVQCHLNSSVIRMENGALIAAESTQMRGAGLSPEQAVQMIIKKKVSKYVATNATAWKKKLQGEGGWSMDVTVTGMPDKSVIDLLTKKIKTIKNISAVSLLTYKGTVAKLSVEGSGPQTIKALIAALPTFKELPMQMTYQAGMETHLQYDIGRNINSKSALFLNIVPQKEDEKTVAMLKQSGPALCASALHNLDFLQGTTVELTTKNAKELLKTVDAKKTPLLVLNTISKRGTKWQNSVEILHVKSKRSIAAATATGANPLEALTSSTVALDTAFRKALSKKRIQKLLAVNQNSAQAISKPYVEIPLFSVEPIYPVLLPLYRTKGVGTLKIKNSGKSALTGIEIVFSVNKKVISSEKIAQLAPGGVAAIRIKPNVLPTESKGRWYGQLEATISYATQGLHGVKKGYAPMLVHEKNTMNWQTPQMLAAFINSSDSSVRNSATKGVKNAKSPLLLTPQLQRASALYEALWHSPLHYVKDPVTTSFSSEIDTVQYPWETMKRTAGDCDDLTVLLASLYESIGLSTIVITTPGHVLLGVESGVLAGGNILFALPEKLFVEKDGALFIPVETTAIVPNFALAWTKGAAIVNGARSKELFRVRNAWKSYTPTSSSPAPVALLFKKSASREKMLETIRKLSKFKVPAWSLALYNALTTHSPIDATEKMKKASSVATANIMLFTGEFDKGVLALAKQCDKGSAASCYNLAVSTLFAQSESKSNISKELKEISTADAVALLPSSIRNMLLDGGGVGMGDEATTTSETEKKLAVALKKAAQRIKKAKKKPSFSGKMKNSSVGGRKGTQSPKSINDIAPLLFWKEVKTK